MQWFDLGSFSAKLIRLIGRVATTAKLKSALLLLIAAVVVSVAVGIFGFRMKRLVMAGLFGVIGFLLGFALFAVVREKVTLSAMMTKLVKYSMAVVIGVAMALMAWFRYKFAMFALYAFIGYDFVQEATFIPKKAVILVGSALLLGLLSVLLYRFAFIFLTSYTGGFGTVIFLSAILPKVSYLQIGTSNVALIIAYVLTLVFIGIQYLIRPRLYKTMFFALQYR